MDPRVALLIAFLTLEDPSGYVIDDHLAFEPLRALGCDVEHVAWTEPQADWRRYDAVVIRSTWDYQHTPEEFVSALAGIERAGVPLFNPLHIVRWNLRKTYLRDLEQRGVAIVPTLWRESLQRGELTTLFEQMGAGEIVLKPIVGANAGGAFRLDARSLAGRGAEVESYYRSRAVMIQPFVQAIEREGEFSLFYFNGEFSHAIVKTPKAGDFRVQEEHGGTIRAHQPDAGLLAAGESALRAIGESLLYVRADFVRGDDGRVLLMELELIEPSLYLRMDPHAPARFAAALSTLS